MYVERRSEGDFAAGSQRASAVAPTQAKAIERAREISPGVAPDVERVRHTNLRIEGNRISGVKPDFRLSASSKFFILTAVTAPG